MANQWDPERPVSAELACSLLESQFPALTPVRLEPLGAGWDNTAYRVNGDLVFRFPRRQIAVSLIETEFRILPKLASRLPVAIPVPEWIGHAEERYAWPFCGYRALTGQTACAIELDDDARSRLAGPLAEFVRALHSVPVQDAVEWGVGPDTIGRLNLTRLIPQYRKSLDRMSALGVIDSQRDLLAIIDAVGEITAAQPVTLIHGDLYARHLLIADQRLTGVIDWGDVHCGNPAVDLSIVWSFLPPSARETFFAVYGPIDGATRALARFRALMYGTILQDYARDQQDARLLAASVHALRLVALD